MAKKSKVVNQSPFAFIGGIISDAADVFAKAKAAEYKFKNFHKPSKKKSRQETEDMLIELLAQNKDLQRQVNAAKFESLSKVVGEYLQQPKQDIKRDIRAEAQKMAETTMGKVVEAFSEPKVNVSKLAEKYDRKKMRAQQRTAYAAQQEAAAVNTQVVTDVETV